MTRLALRGRFASAVSVALVALAGAAAAEPLDLGPARLALDPAWIGAAPAPAPSDAPLVRTHPSGATLTVTRAAVGNPDAWRRQTHDAYVDAIEAGFARTAGYVRVDHGRPRLGAAGVPTLELTFRRTVGGRREIVAVRVLLFRTVTFAAAAAAPDTRAGRRLAEAAVASLTPDA